jgi:hypothetical protein
MSKAVITSTDVGVPISGTVTSEDVSVNLTTLLSAALVISGVGTKAATIVATTADTASMVWLYDGTLAAGTYPCWWKLSFSSGVRTAPTGTTLALHVTSAA